MRLELTPAIGEPFCVVKRDAALPQVRCFIGDAFGQLIECPRRLRKLPGFELVDGATEQRLGTLRRQHDIREHQTRRVQN